MLYTEEVYEDLVIDKLMPLLISGSYGFSQNDGGDKVALQLVSHGIKVADAGSSDFLVGTASSATCVHDASFPNILGSNFCVRLGRAYRADFDNDIKEILPAVLGGYIFAGHTHHEGSCQ